MNDTIWDAPPNFGAVPVGTVNSQGPVEDAQVVNPPPAVSDVNEFKGLPVRAGGDRIFLLKGGKRRWIANAQAYETLGFKFGDEVKIDQETLSVIPEDEPIR